MGHLQRGVEEREANDDIDVYFHEPQNFRPYAIVPGFEHGDDIAPEFLEVGYGQQQKHQRGKSQSPVAQGQKNGGPAAHEACDCTDSHMPQPVLS